MLDHFNAFSEANQAVPMAIAMSAVRFSLMVGSMMNLINFALFNALVKQHFQKLLMSGFVHQLNLGDSLSFLRNCIDLVCVAVKAIIPFVQFDRLVLLYLIMKFLLVQVCFFAQHLNLLLDKIEPIVEIMIQICRVKA